MGGARWSIIARVCRTIVGLGTLAVLSRFLSPAEFGLLALVLFVVQIAQVINDMGTRAALVQRKNLIDLQIYSIFWLNLGLSSIVVTACLILAPSFAAWSGVPEMEAPLLWITPIFLIVALEGVPAALMERRFAFGKLALAEIIANVVSAALVIGLVVAGWGIGALIAQQLAMTAVRAGLIIWLCGWRPRLVFSLTALLPIIGYGAYVSLSGVVAFTAKNINRPMIGNALSTSALGYLSVAQQIITTPATMIANMIRQVLFPILSSIQDNPERIRRAHLDAQHALIVAMAPICLGLIAVRDPFITVALGPGWELVAVLLAYLAVQALIGTVETVNATIFMVAGWVRFDFWFKVVSAALVISVLILSLPYGIEAVVQARLVLAVVLTPVQCIFAYQAIGQSAGAVLAVISRPLAAAVLMTFAVLWLTALTNELEPLVSLVIGVFSGVLIYGSALLLLDFTRVRHLVQLGLSRAPKPAT